MNTNLLDVNLYLADTGQLLCADPSCECSGTEIMADARPLEAQKQMPKPSRVVLLTLGEIVELVAEHWRHVP